jgi:hypothetical protein
MVDHEIWLPGMYIARVVATMSDNDDNTEISTEVHCSPRWSEIPLDSIDAENLNSPSEKCERLDKLVTSQELAGSGESQPELPPNSLRNIAVDRLQGVAIGLQGKESLETDSVTILTQQCKIQGLRAVKESTPGK